MELRPGYKQTEIGVIPDDWEVASLGEHATFRTGPFGSALHKSDYIKDGIPVVNPMHIIDGQIVPTAGMAITEIAAQSLSDFRLREGEIVIGRRGEMGRCAVVRQQQSGWLCGTGSMIVKPSEFNPNFLQRVLSSEAVISAIVNSSVGTTMVNLNQDSLSNLKVQYPPIPEQSIIATALGDMDALLSAQDALIAKKRAIKQGAMQELLTGKRRLPGFSGEWKVKNIGAFTDCTAGGTPSTSVDGYWGGSIRWMNSGELNLRRVYDVEGRITAAGLNGSSTKLIPVSCVLIGLAGQGRTRGTVAMNYVELCTNQSIAAIFPNETFSSEYLYQHLDTRYDELRDISSGGGGRGGLNLAIIRSLEIPFPSVEEQSAIAMVLSDFDTEITALKTQRAKTAQLKQGMMQALLTGRIRLV